MKKITIICALTIISAQVTFSSDQKELLVVNEIRKSIAEDFKLQSSLKEIPAPPPVIEPIPEVRPTPTPQPSPSPRPTPKLEPLKKIVIPPPTPRKEEVPPPPPTPRAKKGLIDPYDGQVFPDKTPKKNPDFVKKELPKKTLPLKKMDSIPTNQSESTDDWMSSKSRELEGWQEEKKSELKAWEDEKKAILDSWAKAHLKYLKKIPEYKKTSFQIPLPQSSDRATYDQVSKNISRPPIDSTVLSEYNYVSGAFSPNVKDQGKRPTCAAFAGIRAIEILMSAQGDSTPLSEQYFYWASKPSCQSAPCSEKGSWVFNGLLKSKKSSTLDIPSARACPYRSELTPSNETQLPLSGGCQQGVVKVDQFYEVKTADEILGAVRSNIPVIGAFKLNESFYKNTGYVFISDPKQKNVQMDAHAAGHALLIIGHMKLPKELQASEGNYCLLVANSWGEGWGIGGHACLSEKWIKAYRYEVPFVAVSRIKL